MTGEEFVRRFMLHIVPRGVHRVRYGGNFHGKGRTARLNQCRQLLIEYNEKNDIHYYSLAAPIVVQVPAAPPPAPEPKRAERNFPKCARCKTPEMQSLGFQDARMTRAIIAITRQVVALYAVSWTTLDECGKYIQQNIKINSQIQQVLLASFPFDQIFQMEVVQRLTECAASGAVGCSQCATPTSYELPIPNW